MKLVSFALSRPITIIVFTIGIFVFSVMALFKIPIDIFPKLNLPTIYVIESYGGMAPQQMEGFFATALQDQYLYVTGIKNIESKNIQGLTLLKLTFYETTNMAEASAQVALQTNRAMKFFPPGALPPQVIRYDASSLPVGELVFSSKTKSLKEITDLAMTRIRPLFATVPGLTAPPPFGGNARSVVINIDPDKARSFNIAPDEVVMAVAKANVMAPSGDIRISNLMYLTTENSLEKTVKDFGDIPVAMKNGTPVYVKDVAHVADAADITVDYALVNGKRSVYIPVVKTAEASTWDVVQNLKHEIPDMQSLLPEDVHISYEFDQSIFVINSVKSLMSEGIIGAILTALMVLLFLRDWRSSMVVIITIPLSILTALFLLNMSGQTINIMTLSGLALAIGILVDEATVTIENIHQHLEMGKEKKRAILDACDEISFPKLLILLCILAVFAPSFMMTGVPKAMFLPLSLAIGYAMTASYLFSQTLVPVMSNWLISADKYTHEQKKGHRPPPPSEALDEQEFGQITRELHKEQMHPEENSFFNKIKLRFAGILEKMLPHRKLYVSIYLVLMITLAGLCFYFIGKDLLPTVNNGQFQMRIKAPDGTRLEETEQKLKEVLRIVDSTVQGHVEITSAYVGLVPASYGVSNLYVFNPGTNEAVLQVNLDKDYKINLDVLKDALRKNVTHDLPDVRMTFEPIEMTQKIMSQGANAPIEVRVAGKDMEQIESYSGKLLNKLKTIPYLRDVQINQPIRYPVIDITLDRLRIAQLGMDVAQVSKSITAFTSSSRFTENNMWLDENAAYTYQVQSQVPEYAMKSLDELRQTPLKAGSDRPVLGDVADFKVTYKPGEYDRQGPRRYLTVSANLYKKDLGIATRDVKKAMASLGKPPTGLVANVGGMSDLLDQTLSSLQTGLMLAIIVIFLLLAATYQSFPVSLVVLVTVPAVVLGSLIALLLTGATLNLQSYMGMIMSVGVSVANAILIVTNSERLRIDYQSVHRAAVTGAAIRLRPILMTSMAMTVGMIPMASGLGEAGDQTAPLGRAVIGGLVASTFAALFILPMAFAWVRERAPYKTLSLMPEESDSNHPKTEL